MDTTGAWFDGVTVRLKVVLIEASPSLAVTLMLRLPISPLPGVPEKVPVAGLKVIQPGSGEPLASVALNVRVSPSGSVKVPAGMVKLRLPSCTTLCAGIGVATTGASLTLVTVRLKSVCTEALLPSVAVTRIDRLPTSALPGVPEKVPVAGLKVSQPGSGEPLASVALKVRVSPSGSVKVPAGTVKFRLPSCATLCAGIGVATTGASLTLVIVRLKSVCTEALLPSVAVTRIDRLPISALPGVPEKVPVAELNVIQPGSGEPLANVALNVRVSPTSGSVKVPAGTVKFRLLPCATLCAGIGVATTGASLTLVMVRLKSVCTEALLPSVAVTRIDRLPISALPGVPEKVPVAELNVIQPGSGEPLANVALNVRVSPTSGSVKVPAGTVKFRLLPCATLCAGIGVATTGASLTLVMVRLKSVCTEALLPSVAVTRMDRLPTSALPGVPEKVPVAELNVIQPGSGEPLASVALRVSVSPTSGSVKVPVGTVKLRLPFCATLCAGIGVATTGASLTLVMVRLKVVLTEALPSLAVTLMLRVPTSLLPGVPVKVPVAGLKVSQLGSGEPLANVALSVSVSPSGSVKVPAGTVKFRLPSCATLCAGIVAETIGASLTLVIVRLKVVLTEALPSLAMTLMLRVPTSALPGVPEKVPVAELKVSQPGSAEPLASVALRERVSPSGSVKVPAGTVKLRLPSCATLCAGIGVATIGASLTLVTVRLKVVLTEALVVSVAVTLMLRMPTSALPGVPVKVPVAGLKVSQLGSGEPLANVALSVSVSPSGSVKVPAGTVKLRLPSCATLCAGIGVATTGGLPTTTVNVEVALLLASSLAVTEMVRLPAVGVVATLT
ncbi:hypothetical protein Q7O_003217 [Pectobacterium carotovorum subsp. carotovorum PCCS1]|nr:hypothetical protein [Pectobacterium carotovorum subsp. carotovorum PCCS1]